MSNVVKKKSVQRKPSKLSVSAPRGRIASTYETDFYKWTTDQSGLLKRGEYSKLDIDNLIEEIESLGRSERSSLKNYLVNLLMHLLKIKYQSSLRTSSWDASVKFSRIQIEEVLEQNPSLKHNIDHVFKVAYRLAILAAVKETGIEEKVFPKMCPWTLEECMTDAGLPVEKATKEKKHKKKS